MGSHSCAGHTLLISSLMRGTYVMSGRLDYGSIRTKVGSTRGEIKNKVEKLLDDEDFRARALKLKEMAMTNVNEGGHDLK